MDKRIVLGAVAAVVVAGGVLTAVLLTNGTDTAATQTFAPAPGEPNSPWRTHNADVTELRTGPGDYGLTVRIQVPGPDPSCVREPHIDHLTETAATITADVVYSTKAETGTCQDKVTAELRLSTATPIAGRTVVLNAAQPWHLEGTAWSH